MVPLKSDLPILQDLTGSMLKNWTEPVQCNSQHFCRFDFNKFEANMAGKWQGMAPSNIECLQNFGKGILSPLKGFSLVLQGQMVVRAVEDGEGSPIFW